MPKKEMKRSNLWVWIIVALVVGLVVGFMVQSITGFAASTKTTQQKATVTHLECADKSNNGTGVCTKVSGAGTNKCSKEGAKCTLTLSQVAANSKNGITTGSNNPTTQRTGEGYGNSATCQNNGVICNPGAELPGHLYDGTCDENCKPYCSVGRIYSGSCTKGLFSPSDAPKLN